MRHETFKPSLAVTKWPGMSLPCVTAVMVQPRLAPLYYDDRLSGCAQRAAESIYLVIDITEAELERIESDALAVHWPR